MGSINDIELEKDVVETGWDDIPEQTVGMVTPPQPGPYHFMLPDNLDDVWQTMDATVNGNKVQRLWAIFDTEHPLTITHSKGGACNGDNFNTRISTAERGRTKAKIMVSDMVYLLRGGLGMEERPEGSMGLARELMKYAGCEFGADIEWRAFCNPKKEIYMTDAEGNNQKSEGDLGCGNSFWQKDIPRVNGIYTDRFECTDCGASLIAFANLVRFHRVATTVEADVAVEAE